MPLLDIFWTLLLLFLVIGWFGLVILILTDVIRNPKLSGWGKALWALFVVFIPWLGVLLYIVSHGRDLATRSTRFALLDDRNAA